MWDKVRQKLAIDGQIFKNFRKRYHFVYTKVKCTSLIFFDCRTLDDTTGETDISVRMIKCCANFNEKIAPG